MSHQYYEQLPRNSNPDYDLENGDQAIEMSNVSSDNDYILNECRSLKDQATAISERIQYLKTLAAREDAHEEYEWAANDTMKDYRLALDRFQTLQNLTQARPTETNVRHINRTKRTLQGLLEEYNQAQQEIDQQTFQRKVRILNVARGQDMSQEEITAMANDTTQTNYFAEALKETDRSGQSQTALNYNKSRMETSARIVAQLTDLNKMVAQFADLVAAQQEPIERIAEKTGETNEQVAHGVKHVEGGIKDAKARNRKKWYCTLAIIIILIIIAIIIAVVVTQNNKK